MHVSEWDGSPWEGTAAAVGGRAEIPPAPVQPGAQVYPTLVPYVDATSALGLSAVFRCVTIIADAIAGLPWQELTGPDDAPARVPSSRLIRRPMANMTRREWTWRVIATEALYGTAHLLHVGGSDSDGVPWSLLPIPPAAITPAAATDPWGLLPPASYYVGDQHVPADYVSVIRRMPFPGLPDHLTGVLRLARRSFGAYLAADTHLARYWQAGGPTLTVLTTEQELTTTDAEAIGQRWADRRARGADFPAVLGKGARAEPFGADPTSDSAVEARREMVADVGRYFGLPTRLLNAPRTGDSETYANVEDDAVDLARYTLEGYYGPVQDVISELLPGDYLEGRRMRFDTTRLTQGSLESRSRAWPAIVNAGIADVDEARRLGFALPPMTAAQKASAAEAIPAAMVEVERGEEIAV